MFCDHEDTIDFIACRVNCNRRNRLKGLNSKNVFKNDRVMLMDRCVMDRFAAFGKFVR